MRSIAFALATLMSGVLLAQEPAYQTPMSSVDAVRLIRLLEEAPLGPDARAVRSDLIDWAAETKDVTITICDVLGPVPGTDVPYGPQLLVHAMLGNGAFQVEHPEIRGDEYKAQLAGIESMLRVYAKLLEADPNARVHQYDEWKADLDAHRLEEKVAPRIQQECLDAPAKP